MKPADPAAPPRPTRDFLTLADAGAGGVAALLDRSAEYQRLRGTREHPRPLEGRSVALIFEKPSTRTLLSLDVAIHELGGHPVVLTPSASQIGRGEPLEDTARVLGRIVHAVAMRTSGTERLETMCRAARVPVVNALSDEAHPLQVLADLHAVRGARGRLEGLRYAWVGDASNVARSWIEAAGLLGLDLVVASPKGFEPPAGEVAAACSCGGRVRVVDDAREAAAGADVLVTDVWVSMGQEAQAAERRRALGPYKLSRELVASASPEVVVLHCLPAHRGEEIDAAVLDGPRSYAWDAVEARLHTAKAVLEWVVTGSRVAPRAGA